jgi:hypothetical protein
LTNLDEVLQRLTALDPDDKSAVIGSALTATKGMPWVPNVGPQTQAFFCEADELLYGGQAGGGKTDLIIGLALTEHKRALILRRINRDAVKLVKRAEEIVGHRQGYNGQLQTWRLPDSRVIEFGGCEHESDKQRYKGDPHDLIAFDEGSDFLESQYAFIIGWNRTTTPGQRCRVVVATNPPTTAEGLWIIKRWRAWLDPTYPYPAMLGELRWYLTIDGEDTEVEGPGPHMVEGRPETARSRTFIPAELNDNPDLARTNYSAVLAGLPEELRRAYQKGDFGVGLKDGDHQVIPTAWILAAQERWTSQIPQGVAMTAMALDPAGGGRDSAELCWRYGGWYAPLISAQGEETADGSATAATVVRYRRDNAPVVVDVGGGYGGAVLLRMKDNGVASVRFNGSEQSLRSTKDGALKFANKRAEAWWRFREELDPDQEGGSAIALPPDAELRSDLAAPTWELTPRGIKLESKEDIKKRLGRSPGKGDAVVMCLSEGTRAQKRVLAAGGQRPKVLLGHTAVRRRV